VKLESERRRFEFAESLVAWLQLQMVMPSFAKNDNHTHHRTTAMGQVRRASQVRRKIHHVIQSIP